MTKSSKKSWAHKLKAYIEDRPIYIVIGLVVVLISQFLTIGGATRSFSSYYNDHFNWRSTENAKINKLAAGLNVGIIQDIYGTPILVKSSEDGRLQEQIFKGKGYWIQAINNREGKIIFYSITVCDPTFNPKYMLPSGQEVTIGKTTFNDIESNPEYVGTFSYILPADAPPYFFESQYDGNPGKFENVVWGFSSVCDNDLDISLAERGLDDASDFESPLDECARYFSCKGTPMDRVIFESKQLNDDQKKQILSDWYEKRGLGECDTREPKCTRENLTSFDHFRKAATINSVGVTAPFVSLPQATSGFTYGPDYLDMRALPELKEDVDFVDKMANWFRLCLLKVHSVTK